MYLKIKKSLYDNKWSSLREEEMLLFGDRAVLFAFSLLSFPSWEGAGVAVRENDALQDRQR